MQESKSSAYVVEGDDCFPHLWLVGNYGSAACRPRRFSLTCRMSRGGVTLCERWLVLWLRRGMPCGVAAEAMERSFSVCGKGGVPDLFFNCFSAEQCWIPLEYTYRLPLGLPSSWHVSLRLFSIVEVAMVAWPRWLGVPARRCEVFGAA